MNILVIRCQEEIVLGEDPPLGSYAWLTSEAFPRAIPATVLEFEREDGFVSARFAVYAEDLQMIDQHCGTGWMLGEMDASLYVQQITPPRVPAREDGS